MLDQEKIFLMELVKEIPQLFSSFAREAIRSPKFYGDQAPGLYALQGFILGLTFATGLWFTALSQGYVDFGLYLTFWSFFHVTEFLFVITYHPADLSNDCECSRSNPPLSQQFSH
jgi:hypothetical protein